MTSSKRKMFAFNNHETAQSSLRIVHDFFKICGVLFFCFDPTYVRKLGRTVRSRQVCCCFTAPVDEFTLASTLLSFVKCSLNSL